MIAWQESVALLSEGDTIMVMLFSVALSRASTTNELSIKIDVLLPFSIRCQERRPSGLPPRVRHDNVKREPLIRRNVDG